VAVTDSVTEEHSAGQDVDAAQAMWRDARSRSRAVGRLADKHREQQRIEQARREQAEADDLASARWRGTEDTDE
jgi:flagellar export protein FliJ